MKRRAQCLAVVVAAAIVLLGFRHASAAGRAREVSVSRVCLAGLGLALSGDVEDGGPAGDAACAIPGVLLGLPGERLLSATTSSGEVIAYRSQEPPAAALGAAVSALGRQGFRETEPSIMARARGGMPRAVEMASPGGSALVVALPAPSAAGSVVLAAVLPSGGGARGEGTR